MSNVVDDEIFPSIEREVQDEVTAVEGDAKYTADKTSDASVIRDETETPEEKEEAGYSEWGMLVTGSSVVDATEDKTPEPPKTETKEVKPVLEEEEESDEEDGSVIDSSPSDVMLQFQTLSSGFGSLQPKTDKFMSRLNTKDPVTKKPRYGERAILRVKRIIRIYKALEIGLSSINDSSIVQSIETQIKQHEEDMQAQAKAIQTKTQLEAEQLENERRMAEKRAEEQRLKEEETKRKEVERLAKQAHEAKLRRLEEEQRVIDAEAKADQELLALVPVKGVEGVRMQISRMRTALKDDRKSLDVALGSLYTLFDQIVRKPEEVNFRRIRRDHPKFTEDIGRHVGGKEVLIAAGFRLEKLDGVPCLFSKEPHIESDMDGWSVWFDGLKKTLEVIEEEMIK